MPSDNTARLEPGVPRFFHLTSPIPPAPIGARISYQPRRVPAASIIILLSNGKLEGIIYQIGVRLELTPIPICRFGIVSCKEIEAILTCHQFVQFGMINFWK